MNCYYLDSAQLQQGPFPDLWISQMIHSGKLASNVQIFGELIGKWLTWNDYVHTAQNYVECPYCGAKFILEQNLIEQKLQCSACEHHFLLHVASSFLLWDLFAKIRDGEFLLTRIQQWFQERERLHSRISADINVSNLGIISPSVVEKILNSETDEERLKQINRRVSRQIFLLCCFVLSKQLNRACVLEFRDYCILSGLSANAFDKILSCELSKAFLVVNHKNDDYNEVYYYKYIAEYYISKLQGANETFFIPTCNALIPWYCNMILQRINEENYLICLEDLRNLVKIEDFMLFSRILKTPQFQKKLETILCSRIDAGDYSKNEFQKLQERLSELPFGLDWLFNSTVLQKKAYSCCIQGVEWLLGGKETVFPDFSHSMLAETSDVENEIAKRLSTAIIEQQKTVKEIKHIFEVLERSGFGLDYRENLFTLKRIYPYLLSPNDTDFFTFPVLLAKKGSLSCPKCLGIGKVLCPRCDGTNKMACPECHGRGTVYSSKTHKDIYCKKCQGRETIRCDGGCEAGRNITGKLKYYVTCSECARVGTVVGMLTQMTGTIEFDHEKCVAVDQNGCEFAISFPLKLEKRPKYMDKGMAEFCECENGNIFYFSDKTGRFFCGTGEATILELMNPEYMIELISGFYERNANKKTCRQDCMESNNGTVERSLSMQKRQALHRLLVYALVERSLSMQKRQASHADIQKDSFDTNANMLVVTDKTTPEIRAHGQPFIEEGKTDYNLGKDADFYTDRIITKEQALSQTAKKHNEERIPIPSEKQLIELTAEEKKYIKAYMVAHKDGVIDATERKMLEYQAVHILNLSHERVEELETLAKNARDGVL